MKYKLLMPLPWIKAWTIFEGNDWGDILDNDYLCIEDENKYYVYWGFAKQHPDFFEPINERELIYPDNLMYWYAVGVSDATWINPAPSHKNKDVMKNLYILWLRFPTEEKAKAYVDLKIDVARFPKTKYWGRFIRFGTKSKTRFKPIPEWCTIDYCGQDFMLPLGATDEEKENRVKLLKAFYWF